MSVRPFTDKEGRPRFVVDYYENGRRGPRVQRVLPEFVNTRELAEEWERAAVYKESDIAPSSEDAGRTVAQLFPKYLSWYGVNREPTSLRDLKASFAHYKQILGHIRVERVALEHIELYKRVRKEMKGRDRKSPVSNRTVNKELSYLSGFLRWAEDCGIIKQRQFKIRMLKYRRPKPLVLTPGEAMAIIQASKPRHRAFFLCLYVLGFRFREAQTLTWENVDFENGAVKVRQKGGSEKILPLLPILREALLFIRPKKPRGIVFKSPRTGGPIIDVRKALQGAAKKTGVVKHVNPHLFRHSIATYLMSRGVHPRVIQDYMGHTDFSVTQWYQHVSLDHLRSAGEAVNRGLTTILEGKLLQGGDLPEGSPQEDKEE